MDLTPLRTSREFRLLWSGQSVSFMGGQITAVALPFHVYQLTGSSLAVGLIALCELVPLLLTAAIGGALADVADRRVIARRAEIGLTVVSALLVVNAALDRPRLWPLYVLAGAGSALYGFSRPAREAMVPRVVPREQIPAAAALMGSVMTVGAILGPSAGGLLAEFAGLPITYAVDTVSFLVSVLTLTAMRPVPAATEGGRVSLSGIADGLRYARSRPVLMGTYVTDFVAMLFGMPEALFPALAVERFGVGSGVLGLLYAAPAAGGFLVTATSGWTARVHRQGAAILLAAGAWGAAIIGFGFSRALVPTLAFLALAGGADMISALFRMAIWNQTVPDELRGRLAGVELLNYSSGPLLGDVEAGVVARLTSVRVSIISGGVACVIGVALTALALPAFRRYDTRDRRD